MDKIEDFIQRRFPENNNWLTGNCFFFALILSSVFPGRIVQTQLMDISFFIPMAVIMIGLAAETITILTKLRLLLIGKSMNKKTLFIGATS